MLAMGLVRSGVKGKRLGQLDHQHNLSRMIPRFHPGMGGGGVSQREGHIHHRLELARLDMRPDAAGEFIGWSQ
jgi:hypothetical protein